MGTLNFVWVGPKPIPDESLLRIQQWNKANPTAQICIWTDNEVLPIMVNKYYATHGYHFSPPLKFKNIKTDIEAAITEFRAVDADFSDTLYSLYRIAVYECSRLRPNYGASSDIFRYLILYLFTGKEGNEWCAYFDHDVATGGSPVESSFTDTSSTLLFLANSQGSGHLGNDAFICRTAHHFILKALLERVLNNYAQLTGILPEARIPLYASDEREAKSYCTIRRTGPRALVATLLDLFKKNKLPAWNETSFIPDPEDCRGIAEIPVSDSIVPAVCPGNTNATAWLSSSAYPMRSSEEAVARAVSSIQLEAELFGILRLDDHVRDVVDAVAAYNKSVTLVGALDSELVSTSLGKPTHFEIAIAEQLVSKIKSINLDRVIERQIISRFAVIRAFYAEKTPLLHSDGGERFGKSAPVFFQELLSGPSSGEPKLTKEQLQELFDSWISTVVPFIEETIKKIEERSLKKPEDARADYLELYMENLKAALETAAAYEIKIELTIGDFKTYESRLEAMRSGARPVPAVFLGLGEGGARGGAGAGGARGGAGAAREDEDEDEGEGEGEGRSGVKPH